MNAHVVTFIQHEEAEPATWTIKRLDPHDFGQPGRPFWVSVDPKGAACDKFFTKREAKAAIAELIASGAR